MTLKECVLFLLPVLIFGAWIGYLVVPTVAGIVVPRVVDSVLKALIT